MEGILNIDKPSGLTSHDVVARVRHLSHIRRVGHTGTLDPLATGVLVICLGRATRLVEYVTGQPKSYLATIRLGQETNTYDTEGEIVAERPLPTAVPLTYIENHLSAFQGQIAQQPPLYSAIKKDGQPAYKLARQGKEVTLEPRQVTVYEIKLLAWEQPFLQLQIHCSAGTYVRSIAHDLGQALGYGGHLTALRRTAVGAFTVDTAVTLDSLTAANITQHLLPADHAVQHLPAVTFSADNIASLFNGLAISRQPDDSAAKLARAYDPQGAFAGIVQAQGAQWRAKKMFIPPVPTQEKHEQ